MVRSPVQWVRTRIELIKPSMYHICGSVQTPRTRARVRLQGCLDVLSRGFKRHLDWFKGGILHKEPYVRVSKGDVSNLALHVLVAVGELFSWLMQQLDRTSGLPGRFDQGT